MTDKTHLRTLPKRTQLIIPTMASEVPPAGSPGAEATAGSAPTPTDPADAAEETSAVRAGSKAFAPPGTPVLTVYGTGVILRHRADGDLHRVRLWAPRGGGAADAFLQRDTLVRVIAGAVGFQVRTPMGRGVVRTFRGAAGAGAGDAVENTADDTTMARVSEPG